MPASGDCGVDAAAVGARGLAGGDGAAAAAAVGTGCCCFSDCPSRAAWASAAYRCQKSFEPSSPPRGDVWAGGGVYRALGTLSCGSAGALVVVVLDAAAGGTPGLAVAAANGFDDCSETAARCGRGSAAKAGGGGATTTVASARLRILCGGGAQGPCAAQAACLPVPQRVMRAAAAPHCRRHGDVLTVCGLVEEQKLFSPSSKASVMSSPRWTRSSRNSDRFGLEHIRACLSVKKIVINANLNQWKS